jgi:hypothetical protein
VRLAQFGRLLGYRAALGIAGSRVAGERLISALGADDEGVRTVAGMFLTRAGTRAEPFLVGALRRRESVPAVLEVLASIGDETAEREAERLMHDADPEIASAASDAYRVIQFQRKHS